MALSHGMLIGWFSPATIVLSGDESPMVSGPVDIALISWIGGISNVGSLIGNFLYTWMTNRFGRRVAFFWLALPNMVSIGNGYRFLCIHCLTLLKFYSDNNTMEYYL